MQDWKSINSVKAIYQLSQWVDQSFAGKSDQLAEWSSIFCTIGYWDTIIPVWTVYRKSVECSLRYMHCPYSPSHSAHICCPDFGFVNHLVAKSLGTSSVKFVSLDKYWQQKLQLLHHQVKRGLWKKAFIPQLWRMKQAFHSCIIKEKNSAF